MWTVRASRVDALGRGCDEARAGARGDRGEIEGQVGLAVGSLQESRHHSGVVVAREGRDQNQLHFRQGRAGSAGQDVDVRVSAAQEDEPPGRHFATCSSSAPAVAGGWQCLRIATRS